MWQTVLRWALKGAVRTELHLFWSGTYSCWKAGVLSEDKAGILRNAADGLPWEVKKPWMLVKEHLCRADSPSWHSARCTPHLAEENSWHWGQAIRVGPRSDPYPQGTSGKPLLVVDVVSRPEKPVPSGKSSRMVPLLCSRLRPAAPLFTASSLPGDAPAPQEGSLEWSEGCDWEPRLRQRTSRTRGSWHCY